MKENNNELWLEIEEMFRTSKIDININKDVDSGAVEICDALKISSESALGAIVLNTSGIVFDNWIRLYGCDTDDRNGISKINFMSEDGELHRIDRMLIVATDVVGGIFAINAGKFDDGIGDIWYFAPDTLDWENLELKYSQFLAWLSKGNVEEFYKTMKWEGWREYSKDVGFDEGILIYPFLWAEELDIENASKSIVPYEELFDLSMEHRRIFLDDKKD